jgi:hypothetical protein
LRHYEVPLVSVNVFSGQSSTDADQQLPKSRTLPMLNRGDLVAGDDGTATIAGRARRAAAAKSSQAATIVRAGMGSLQQDSRHSHEVAAAGVSP